jgi:hypothetical protein
MVRAAATGAIDYAGADPYDRQWRLKHRLMLREIHRREEHALLDIVHRHWCAYLSHGGLNDDSFQHVKTSVTSALTSLDKTIFPWDKPEQSTRPAEEEKPQNSTIDATTQALIDRYRQLTAQPPVSD